MKFDPTVLAAVVAICVTVVGSVRAWRSSGATNVEAIAKASVSLVTELRREVKEAKDLVEHERQECDRKLGEMQDQINDLWRRLRAALGDG